MVTLLVPPPSSIPVELGGDVASNASLMNSRVAKTAHQRGRKTSSQEPLTASEEGEGGGFEAAAGGGGGGGE